MTPRQESTIRRMVNNSEKYPGRVTSHQILKSRVDGWVTLEIFLKGHQCRRVAIGPRGGVKSDITTQVS